MNLKRPNGRYWIQFLTVFISRGISKLADLSLLPDHPFSFIFYHDNLDLYEFKEN